MDNIQLPPELVGYILTLLEPDDSSTIRDLLSCSLASVTLLAASRRDVIWREIARHKYKGRGTPISESASAYEYCKMRHLKSSRASSILHELARVKTFRIPLIDEVRGMGEDVADDLDYEGSTTRLSDLPRREPDFHMTVRYYARVSHHAVYRDRAIKIWQKIRDSPEEDGFFELGLLAFTNFRGQSQHTVQAQFDTMSRKLADILQDTTSDNTPERIALAACRLMTDSGFKVASNAHFHDLDNHFLDMACRYAEEGGRRGTIPMSLVGIFCAIVRRLPAHFNIVTKPIGFPGTMLAAVATRERAADGEWAYVDAAEPNGRMLSRQDLFRQLSGLGLTREPEFYQPATPHEMCLRTARNIMASIRHGERGFTEPDHPTLAMYAAATCLLSEPTDRSTLYATWVVSLCQSEFYFDVGFIETEVLQYLQDDPDRKDQMESICQAIRAEDGGEIVVKTRKDAKVEIKWNIGHVFHHRLFAYLAAVTGWDQTCEASEEWIQAMHVDTLPLGRHQPFYHVITREGETRYVAQENITDDDTIDAAAMREFRRTVSLGRYLRKPIKDEETGRWRFLKSVESEALYPDS